MTEERVVLREMASPPAPTAAAVPPVDAPRSLLVWSKVRENAEAVIVAIVLALIIRHFSLEAFEIPTGSMAPGLYGVHLDTVCPNCGTESAVSIGVDSVTGKLNEHFKEGYHYEGACPDCGTLLEDILQYPDQNPNCPRCKETRPQAPDGTLRQEKSVGSLKTTCRECEFAYKDVYTRSDTVAGHKILVNKFIYQIRDPRRWEVIVFKFNRQRNYIKRLVGLPGEEIQVIGGDIFIDGTLERKPVWAQDALWYQVHDSAVAERFTARREAWRSADGWERSDGGSYRFAVPGGETSRLTYEREIRSHSQYNDSYSARGAEGPVRVRDLRLLATVAVEQGEGAIALGVVNNRKHFEVWLPVGAADEGAMLRFWETHPRESVVLDRIPGTRLAVGVETEVDFYLADRGLVLRIDGEVIREFPLPETVVEPFADEPNHVELQAQAAGGGSLAGRVERVRIFRDIQYTTSEGGSFRYAVDEPCALGEGEFFAMGDNSGRSQDSRVWGKVNRDNLLGRAFCIFWPALPWRWEIGFIR